MDTTSQVAIDSDVVLDPGEIMIAHMSIKKPPNGIDEYTVLETKPMGKHEIILWPSTICSDGMTNMCIANRGPDRIGIRAGDIIGVARNMSKRPTGIDDVKHVMAQLEQLVTYPDMPIPMAETATPLDTPRHQTVNNVFTVQPVDICEDLSAPQQAAIRAIVQRRDECFASKLTEVGELKVEPYRMVLKEGAIPKKVAPYTLPKDANDWLKGYLSQLEEIGFIEKCNGPWAAGALLIPSDVDKRVSRSRIKVRPLKKEPRLRTQRHGPSHPVWILTKEAENDDEHQHEEGIDFNNDDWYSLTYGKEVPTKQRSDANGNRVDYNCSAPPLQAGEKDPYRLVFNYKPINAATVDSGYPIPNIHELFTRLGGANYFTIMDAMKGFWQLPLHEDSRDLTGFVVNCGGYSQWRWTRLSMGLKGSPGAWQSIMDTVFKEAINVYLMVYIDDVVVCSKTFSEHLKHLEAVFDMAGAVNLSFSRKKCKFGYSELKILGYKIGREGFGMLNTKVDKIIKWPPPKDKDELSRFIGSIQYYRRFIPHFSSLLEPLNKLRRKGVSYTWEAEQQECFDECKRLMSSDPILKHPDFDKKFYLSTDASDTGIGAVLTQKSEEESSTTQVYLPIYFGSRSLSPSERRYSTYEREFLAIVYFVNFFRLYLLGQEFVVVTDHKALSFLATLKENTSARVARWMVTLSMFDFEIRYLPGRLNVLADAMSRLPVDVMDHVSADDVIVDEYLPINAIGEEDKHEDSSIKRRRVDSYWGGMDEELYRALALYLSSLKFKEQANQEERQYIRRVSREYTWFQGLLYRKATATHPARRVLTSSGVLEALRLNHDHMLAGHTGVKSTFEKLSRMYYWPCMYEDIRRYVLSCPVCQMFGPRPKTQRVHPWPPAESGPFSRIMIDYFSMPMSARGNNAVLIGIDTFTGWIEAKPMASKTALGTAYFIYEWVCRHGVPQEIVSDNGSHFTAWELQDQLNRLYGLTIKTGSSWRPQRQGQIERAIQTVRKVMERLHMTYQGSWEMWLSAAEFVCRTSINRRHGYTPFFLAYGREPRLPVCVQDIWQEQVRDGDGLDEASIRRTIPEKLAQHWNEDLDTGAINMLNNYAGTIGLDFGEVCSVASVFHPSDSTSKSSQLIIKRGFLYGNNIPNRNWLLNRKAANDIEVLECKLSVGSTRKDLQSYMVYIKALRDEEIGNQLFDFYSSTSVRRKDWDTAMSQRSRLDTACGLIMNQHKKTVTEADARKPVLFGFGLDGMRQKARKGAMASKDNKLANRLHARILQGGFHHCTRVCEYNTTKMCCHCVKSGNPSVTRYLQRPSPIGQQTSFRVLYCSRCRRVTHRDGNAGDNQATILRTMLATQKRPACFIPPSRRLI
ncbi:hypothetical protein O0I10_007525 [Lichtheimia ornata]|uniref:Reverse transcriptase n=1 Tax=Lichtheimia ornata TaxID=688661 RepID=A0AAD7XXK5_9FUNG|nr:uncharacterized protein O0I10_007525 [Lichtheimia ornata]KAJ8656678.1 hypothetical protein O0I10_007525 [Lichtheimia ornata]